MQNNPHQNIINIVNNSLDNTRLLTQMLFCISELNKKSDSQ